VLKVGAVAIGRNEGARLAKCLKSAIRCAAPVVYVDSGSTDDSVALARRLGADVVELDMRLPFTAARARNAGFDRLRQQAPDHAYVQFVDGDCEIADGWIEQAAAFLDSHTDVAVACGRRREQHPERSIYNRLCDIEWNTPIGEARACGGDALMRTQAFEQAGGYRADLIAGEEPELCIRLRAAGWRIWRIDREMTLHDAAMTRFGQWWRRVVRSGYAHVQGVRLHGAGPERHYAWATQRAWLLGVYLPFACLVIGLALPPWGWLVWLVYPLHVLQKMWFLPGPIGERALRASFLVLARFAEGMGQVKFHVDRLLGRQARLIEYK
jgi:glycosyltransferase involved in cell wall biosynthesis